LKGGTQDVFIAFESNVEVCFHPRSAEINAFSLGSDGYVFSRHFSHRMKKQTSQKKVSSVLEQFIDVTISSPTSESASPIALFQYTTF
jgi:hypothetical protein